MLNDELIIKVNRQPYFDGIELYGFIENKNTLGIAQPLVVENGEYGRSSNAFCKLTNSSAQYLIDELWRCGLRPTDGTGSAGSLLATEKHLDDMRKIVAKKLDVDLLNINKL